MVVIGSALARLGRNGPLLLVLSLLLGAALPELSRIARSLLPASAFLLVSGALLAAAMSPPERGRSKLLLAAAKLFVFMGAPLATMLALRCMPLGSAIELGAVAAALAPPTGSVAAVAVMLSLQPRLAVFLFLTLTLAAPITMPLMMALFAVGDSAFSSTVALRLVAIIGAAALIAAPPLRFRLQAAGIVPDAAAASGVSVIGLVIVGVATAGGVMEMAGSSARLIQLFSLAIGLNLGLTLLGAALFARCGLATALTIGLAAGNRNVTLAWAAGAGVLPADAQTYLAVCVVPILLLPVLIKASMALIDVETRRAARPA